MSKRRGRKAKNRRVIGVALFTALLCMGTSYAVKDAFVDKASLPAPEETTQIVVVEKNDINYTKRPALTVESIILEVDGEGNVQPENVTEETNTDGSVETETEILAEPVKPVRENTLYYVQDGIYRYDLEAEYQDYVWEQCKQYGIEEHYPLIIAQMYHESKFNPDAVSSTNDYGLMQINICNHKWLSGIIGDDDFLNPYTSIRAGVYLMSGYLNKYNDVQKALVCYNRGESAVRNGTYTTTYSKCVVSDVELLLPNENQ